MTDMRVTITREDGTQVTVSGAAAAVLKEDLDRGMTFPGMKDAFTNAEEAAVPQEKAPPKEKVVRKK